MSTKVTLSLAIALISAAGMARTLPDASALHEKPVEYPLCTAKVTDKCVEQKPAAKAPTRPTTRSKIVRRDKVHLRKGA
jgi:hypothetical protein